MTTVRADDFSPFSWVVALLDALVQYDEYQPLRNDPLSVPDPKAYFASRALDTYVPAAMSYVRWERCRIVKANENEGLRKKSALARALSSNAEALQLAAILRPIVELHVDLAILREHRADPLHLATLCRHLIHKHTIGDYEQRLKTCEEAYKCRPSYYSSAVAGHRAALSKLESELSRKGIPLLSSQMRKYIHVAKSAVAMDRVALGPDSFAALAQLAYHLHFLPQKTLTYSDRDLEHLRVWCAWACLIVGLRLCELVGFQPPGNLSIIEPAMLEFAGKDDGVSEHCPAPGSVLLLPWGVARVEDIEPQPWGNEVLSLAYELIFVSGVSESDRIPRRFTNIRLNQDLCHEAIASIRATLGSPLSVVPTVDYTLGFPPKTGRSDYAACG